MTLTLLSPGQLTAATIFSGGGGADAALRKLGFKIVGALEREPKIAAVYRENFGDHIAVADALGFDYRRWEGIDLLHASPVCKGYSNARSRELPPHPDNNVGYACIEAIEAIRPRWFTLENVSDYRKSDVYKAIHACLEKHGYRTFQKVINCKDHGVPQNRKRLVLVASRDNIDYRFPEPKPEIGWYAAIEHLLPDCPETTFAEWQKRRLKDFDFTCLINEDGKRSRGVPADAPSPTVTASGSGARFKAILVDNNRKALRYPEYRPAPAIRSAHQGALRVLMQRAGGNKDRTNPRGEHEPAPTLTCGGGHSHTLDVIELIPSVPPEYIKIVKLTPRCLATLCTFPADYRLPPQVTLATEIIGNCFPPNAYEEIVRCLLESTENRLTPTRSIA
jgi:DNA-cytosine methyltransferase